ncbi:MAG TPA: AAA-like domain-containing protein [Candidatus Deferrimicrobium sp.]|nr:AAA-like domain-containing protein [Candidatus Deferrimicrobium sp.]
MKKRFNITGVCFPEEHYMVDVSNKLNDIFAMVEQGDYFVINRPRQYGKTTTLYMLNRRIKTSGDFFPINISFEGIGAEGFDNAAVFIEAFFLLLKQEFKSSGNTDLMKFLESSPIPDRIDILGAWISELVEKTGKKIVLMIDEVDKSSNNQLFLDFLGMLRNKYLKRREPGQLTFHSVILAGVHDVKSLKIKIRKDSEPKFNSPWNIAVDFKVDLSFSVNEIQSMLEDYSNDQQVTLDISYFAERLFYLTSGYPFLVSQLCKIIHEELLPTKKNRNEWQPEDLEKAVQISLNTDNTNSESLIQNLENDPDLYELVFDIIMNGAQFSFNTGNPLILFGKTYGVLKEEMGKAKIHNRLYEQRIYNYMASKMETAGKAKFNHFTARYLDETGDLDIKKVILKFQDFMKEVRSPGES